MDGIPIIRSAAFWTVVPALENFGLPIQPLMRSANLPDETMLRPDLLVPERSLWDMFHHAWAVEGFDDIGFRVGSSHTAMDVPGLGRKLAGQATLLQLIRAFCINLISHNNCWNFWIGAATGGIRVCRGSPPFKAGAWPMEQYAIAYLTQLVRMAGPEDWTPSEIWLQTDSTIRGTEKSALRDARLHYEQPFTAIFVPASLLPLQVRYQWFAPTSPYTRPIDFDFPTNLRQIIRSYIKTPGFGLNALAELVDLPSRTLQRKLAAHGSSYRKILRETRFEEARSLLTSPDFTVTDVAYSVGYKSVSAFDSEFRKWAGMSPGQFRRAWLPKLH